MLALRFGQQGRAPVVGGAVPPGQRRAVPVALGQPGFVGDPVAHCPCSRRYAATRLAESLPEMSTIGTPPPGTVPDPAKNIPGSRRSTLDGRKGPVWLKVW